MATYVSGVDAVVDSVELFLDTDDSTENLREQKEALEDDALEIGPLISELQDWLGEAEDRISEIDDELEARKAAEAMKEAA
jgi:hypothetical protein